MNKQPDIARIVDMKCRLLSSENACTQRINGQRGAYPPHPN